MEKKDIKVASIKRTGTLEFNVLSDALNQLPQGRLFYIPRKAERWLKDNCEGDCYLISVERDHEDQFLQYCLGQYYLGIFDEPNDAILFKLIWG
ncbi:MAG: hypothetical protein HC836_25825 [Richelia sp. RM2_1_2]|nr:hypothetical protein [Richelia sp. RM2_1_2]